MSLQTGLNGVFCPHATCLAFSSQPFLVLPVLSNELLATALGGGAEPHVFILVCFLVCPAGWKPGSDTIKPNVDYSK